MDSDIRIDPDVVIERLGSRFRSGGMGVSKIRPGTKVRGPKVGLR